MKSRKNPKKYVVGGLLAGSAIIGGLAGLGQSIWGGVQANRARKDMERIKKGAPDLNAPIAGTPSEYYKAYKDAYNQDIMNRQMESIKTGLAGTTEALSGAGGRALLGGIGAATQQAQRQTQGIADLQQQRQIEALQNLGAANERTRQAQEARLAMREGRYQTDLDRAAGERAVGQANIGAGIGQIGSSVQGYLGGLADIEAAKLKAGQAKKGMVVKTPGPFSHEKNPIDIMQNGKKIAEATGGEYIFNPKQMSNIKRYVANDDKSKLHSYVKALIKKFEK